VFFPFYVYVLCKPILGLDKPTLTKWVKNKIEHDWGGVCSEGGSNSRPSRFTSGTHKPTLTKWVKNKIEHDWGGVCREGLLELPTFPLYKRDAQTNIG
jgi:hypothetical protein